MRNLIATLGMCIALLGVGCGPTEGERCNPLLFTDECGNGLTCTYPKNCGVAYCCPVNSPSGFASCQPCPAPDGGASD